MKVCPTCGTAFDGPETFCPHDGSRLFEAKNKVGQWIGKTLDDKVKLDRHLFTDELGERYLGERLDGQGRVRVTLFNMGFEPSADRIAALRGTRAILESPLPVELTEVLELNTEGEVSYLIESDPQGASLRLLLTEREHLDWPTATKLICSLARVVDWMDQTGGIVHRALHPQAIYVTQLSQGKICVAEWAHGVLATRPNPLDAAAKGEVVPYSEYMAPELTEDSGKADKRSSLYTLGMLFYELLVGSPPHTAPSVEEVLKRHKRERPAKLSVVSKDPTAGTTLDEIFELITGPKPEARFQAPMALINALGTLLQAQGDFEVPALERAESAPAPLKVVKINEEPPAAEPKAAAVVAPQEDEEDSEGEAEAEVEDARRSTLLFVAPTELTQQAAESVEAGAQTSTTSTSKKKKRAKKPAAEPVEAKSAEVEDTSAATEHRDLSNVLEQDRKRQEDKVRVDDPEENSERADKTPSSKIIVDEQALQSTGAISGQSETTTTPPGIDDESAEDESGEDEGAAQSSGGSTKKKKRRKRTAETPAVKAAAPASKAEPAKAEKVEEKKVEEPAAKAEDKPKAKEEPKVEAKVEAKPEVKAPAPEEKKVEEKKVEEKKVEAPAEKKPAETKAETISPPKAAKEEPPRKADSTGEHALPETWFETSTEPAWDQSYLEEHSRDTEQRFRKILIVAMALFVIAFITFILWIAFGPDKSEDEEASLQQRIQPVAEQLFKRA